MSSRPLKFNPQARVRNEHFLEDDAARLVLALDGEIVFASAACETLAGLSGLKGENFLEVASFDDPDDAFRASPLFSGDDIFAAIRSGLHNLYFPQSGSRLCLQFDIVKAQDGTRYVIASALPNDEAFSRTIETLLNQTAAETSVDAAQFMDLSSDLMCVAGQDGTFEGLNAKFSDILGFALEDLAGRTFLDLVHPDDRAAVRTTMRALFLGQNHAAPVDFDCRLITNQARIVWMEWKHRRVNGRLYSAGRDVSAAKKHEQALLQQERQLSEAEAIGKMGHWHWPIGQQEIKFSDEIYRIFGVTRGRFVPTLESVNAMLHRRDAGQMIQAFQRAIIQQNDHEIDFQVRTPDGEIRHVRCQGRCEFDADGDVTGLYGIMQDVTQTMAHEHALMEAKDAAERAYAAKSQFLANMSHELRTPLNAIIGFSEMMQQQLLGPIGNERYLDYIKGINESGQHLLDLITDILDMSKIEAGKYELDIAGMNLAKVMRLAMHMVESRASDAKIRIVPKFTDENLTITADRRAVMQIMLNLLSNAVKFSRPQTTIDVESLVSGDHVILRVRDQGIGIPASKLPTITNPFEQAANQYTRSHEGSGLGLSITKELAELHGGSIHIESTVDVGTTVTIRLPLDCSATRRDAGAAI